MIVNEIILTLLLFLNNINKITKKNNKLSLRRSQARFINEEGLFFKLTFFEGQQPTPIEVGVSDRISSTNITREFQDESINILK